AFTSDGRRLLTLNDSNRVQVWDLSPDQRPREDLALLVSVLSGQEIDRTGATSLSATRGPDWQKLKRAYPDAFTVPEHQLIAWREAEDEARKAAGSEERTLYANRGERYASQGRYAEAAADLTRSVELAPDNLQGWSSLAHARLGAGDVPGYRRTCAALLR